MLRVFTYPEARRRLYNWDTPLMLAQVPGARAHEPDNVRLANIIQEILSVNEDAHPLLSAQREKLTYGPTLSSTNACAVRSITVRMSNGSFRPSSR